MFINQPSIFNLVKNLCFIVFFGSIFLSESAAQQKNFILAGEIKDQQGAAIITAETILKDETGKRYESVSRRPGEFRFQALKAGKYKLQVSAAGFAVYETEIETAEAEKQPKLAITLYPTVTEEVQIQPNEEIPLSAERAAGTQVLTARELEALPDDPEQLSEQLQQLAATGGGVPGQAVVTVDGFLNNGRLPSKSSIRQVKINPNLYSAEYDTPPFQGGRIEILTKPGADKFNGSTFFNYNGTHLNARYPLAAERAATQTNRYGFQLGGPLIKNKAGFFFDFEKRDIDESSTVNAVRLDENFKPVSFNPNVPNPQRLIIGSIRADYQANQTNTLVFRYDFNRNDLKNQGIGGINLPERGFDNLRTENNFRLTETSVVNPRMFNELRVGLSLVDNNQTALSKQPAIIVAGAFASGGAGVSELRHNEKILEIADSLTLETKKHSLKFGVTIFNRRIDEVRMENPNGTYFFGGGTFSDGGIQTAISSLEQYRRTVLGLTGGVPTRFSLTTGAPPVSVSQWLMAGFIQDDWKFNRKLLFSFGLRYEAQNYPDDAVSLAPRIGLAYTPDKKQQWVLRARAGIFYQRISETLFLETERFDGQRQQQIFIDSPAFPNPFLNGSVNNSISTIRIFDARVRPPANLQTRVEIERQLPKGWKISSSYSWTRGWAQLRSRNINAPVVNALNPNPQTASRPLGGKENILQFESSGRISGSVLFIGANQYVNKYFTINLGYLNFDFKTDADNSFAMPQSSYDFDGEWAAPMWQSRHRFFLSSSVNLPRKLRLFALIQANSGTPYNVTTGQDNNGDGNFNDRPGIAVTNLSAAIATQFGGLNPNVINGNLPRNAGTNPGVATVDLNLSRTFSFGKKANPEESRYKLALNVRASNVLNHANLLAMNGILTSPLFGRPLAANPARRVEFGARLNF